MFKMIKYFFMFSSSKQNKGVENTNENNGQTKTANLFKGIFSATYEIITSIPKSIKTIRNARNNTTS